MNGSYISRKPEPGDCDTLFVYDEASEDLLEHDERARLAVDYRRCKEQGFGDLFILSRRAAERFPTFCRMDVFDFDKASKVPKGVVEVDL